MRRFHPANLRAAWWALRTARRTRRLLDANGLDGALDPPPPAPLPMEAERGVRAALRRVGETCLVNAIVLQAWEAAHGRRRDLIVGITGPNDFLAHAWLQGDAVPTPDEAAVDVSVLNTDPNHRRATRGDGDGSSGDRRGDLKPFTELLRRPAPRYQAGPTHGPPLGDDSAVLYRIHGLLVESEIPLQARRVGPGGSPGPDYRVVAGEIRECPHSPPPGRVLAQNQRQGFGYWAVEAPGEPRCWTLRYAGICEITLDRGERTITVHRAPESDPGMLPIFIEGSVLAHTLTAEGVLVIHASAVEVGGRVLAICGPSGAGKSTLAALLCSTGARLVTDDVLRVDRTESGAVCFPGNLGLRLRPAAASLGGDIEGAAVGETADGRAAVIVRDPVEAPLELAAALVPAPSRTAPRLEMHRLRAMEGLQELLRYPRLTRWQDPDRIARLFQTTGEIAEAVPVYRATVPWGPPFAADLADELLTGVGLIQRHARV